MTEGSQPLAPTLQPHEKESLAQRQSKGGFRQASPWPSQETENGGKVSTWAARAHVQVFGPLRPSCPDGFRPPSVHPSFLVPSSRTSPLFLPQAEPGSGQAPPTCHFLRQLVGLGAGHTSSPPLCSHSLFGPCRGACRGVGRPPSFTMIAMLPGGPLDSTPSKMRMGWLQWLEFACCL